MYQMIDPKLHPKQWQKAITTKEVSCLVPSTLPRYPFSAAKKLPQPPQPAAEARALEPCGAGCVQQVHYRTSFPKG